MKVLPFAVIAAAALLSACASTNPGGQAGTTAPVVSDKGRPMPLTWVSTRATCWYRVIPTFAAAASTT